jgi:apolipoprotein D and lipocalin family protein
LTSVLTAEKNNIKPVESFDLSKYLGKWYEIARYDHSFERGLEEVTAEYSIREDGKVKVLNSGFSDKHNKVKNAEGYAKFAKEKDIGELKVTFFWPFFGTYRIAILDENYQYALVVGADYKYLWILSRKRELDKFTIDKMIDFLKQNNFDTDKIMWVRHK